MTDELPDAPWGSGSNSLPDAPWATNATPASTGPHGAVMDALRSAPHAVMQGITNAIAPLGRAAATESALTPQDLELAKAVPGAQESEHILEQNVTGPLPQAQTPFGKITSGAIEAASNPAAYISPLGPFGAAAMASLSGAAGSMGEQLTGSPWGGFVSALLAPLSVSKGISVAKNISRAGMIPTSDELMATSNNQFGQARKLGVKYDPDAVADLKDTIKSKLLSDGHEPDELSGGAFNRVERLGKPIEGVDPNSFSHLLAVRNSLNSLRNEAMRTFTPIAKPNARAAAIAIDHIDDFLSDSSNAVSGPAEQAALLAQDARGNWKASAQSKLLETAREKGENAAAASGTGANIDNALRQKVRALLDNPKRIQGWSQEERDGLESIVHGDVPANAARLVGKLASTGIVSTAGGQYLAHVLGLGAVGHTALPVVGYMAKKTGDFMARGRIDKLLKTISAQSPLGQSRNIPLPGIGGMAPGIPAAISGIESTQSRARGGRVNSKARRAPDGHFYIPDHNRPGKYLMVLHHG